MAKRDTSGKGAGGGDGEKPDAGKPYVVLARKYRPATFDDLIGQDAMVTTLRNAFASGRIAQGYMLTGVRGVGKTTTARILARGLNYEPGGPTVELKALGRHCAEIMESRHPDVVELDAASNTGVDNIREIIESARYKPLVARYKVFIIDEVHMLSKGAFNALLKTLEEPPEHVKFIFATTEIRKVPVTVLSRCQRFDLKRVEAPLLARHFRKIALEEGARPDDEALMMIARAAEGSVRDGLSILDQAIAMGHGEVHPREVRAMLGLADRGRIFDLLELVLGGDVRAVLSAFGALHHDGAEPLQVLTDLAEAAHTVTRAKVAGEEGAGEGLPLEERRRAASLAGKLSVPLLARVWQMLAKGIDEGARAPDPVAAAEMVLIRIAHTSDLPSPDEIIKALGGESVSAGRARTERTQDRPAGRPAVNELAPKAEPAVSPASAIASAAPGGASAAVDADDPDAWRAEQGFEPVGPGDPELAANDSDEGLGLDEDQPTAPAEAPLRTFAEVVALVGKRRDMRLKVHLEEHVSLVKFDAAAGSIDIFLLPGAPPEIANDLREKLNRWTNRRWVVVLSKSRGELPIAEVRRQREAVELEQLKRHPAVQAVLKEFPDARIADVRPLAGPIVDEDTGTGSGAA